MKRRRKKKKTKVGGLSGGVDADVGGPIDALELEDEALAVVAGFRSAHATETLSTGTSSVYVIYLRSFPPTVSPFSLQR